MPVFGCANDEQFYREIEHHSICDNCLYFNKNYNSCTNKHFCEKLKIDYDRLLSLLDIFKK